MRFIQRFASTWAVATIAILTAAQDAATQQPSAVSVAAGQATGVDRLRQWDEAVDRLIRTGDLVVTSRFNDRTVPGRGHEYLAQTVDGIPVLGGGISRQLDGAGVTISLIGTLHQNIDVDTTPTLTTTEAVFLLERAQGGRFGAERRPSLVVLPLPDGAYALAHRIVMGDGRIYFVHADDGRILHVADAFRRQSAVGAGSDFLGRRKKVSTTRDGTGFHAHDRLRPAEIVTLDGRFILFIDRLIFDHFLRDVPPGVPIWTRNDVARDTDNDWEDPAIVEAHTHTGWTYDYLYARHGWRGLDGNDGRILSIANVDLGFPNALAFPPPFGPEGTGVYVYGRPSGQGSREPLSSLDVVAHELMHGVTHFAVSRRTGDPAGLMGGLPTNMRLGPRSFTDQRGQTWTCHSGSGFWCVDGRFLLGSNETGAVNEAYSDIVGEAVGFFHEDAGATADYLQGGDQTTFGPFRSLADPGSLSILEGSHRPYPDAYAGRYEFALARAFSITNSGVTDLEEEEPPIFWRYTGFVFVDGRFSFSLGGSGYGGDHWNSTILSHAFYLAIEGGRNRTTGTTVEGVGDAGRGEVERIFFRALTDLMPPAATLQLAADAIRQAADDLGSGSEAQRAVEEALVAIGLPPA